ncbi:MAG TPA: hypothetical protein VMB72_13800 [Acidimicrobiales bacterium]|nr:hypothetical protein [Acidimicrobiales bacterium]
MERAIRSGIRASGAFIPDRGLDPSYAWGHAHLRPTGVVVFATLERDPVGPAGRTAPALGHGGTPALGPGPAARGRRPLRLARPARHGLWAAAAWLLGR